MGHEINLFWAAHVVHHQSEEFNLTAAVRITLLQSFVRTAFWCVLPVVGFSPEMVVSILLIHGGYSFFTHTQLIGKLGWLEKIFITPSHHRVHHGSNPEYLDKNYGDIFVFWDKIFGTFKEETIPATYGLVKPLDSYSFLWGHFHFSIELWTAMRAEASLRKKVLLLFGKPESLDPRFIPVAREAFGINPKSQQLTLAGIIYVVVQLALLLAGLAWMTKFYLLMNAELLWLGGALVLISLVNVSALLEQKRWVYYLEYFRFFLLVLLGVELEYLNFEALIGVSCFLILCIPLPIKTYYRQTVLGIK